VSQNCSAWLIDVMTLLHHGHQEHRFIVILGLGQIYPLLPWLAAIFGPMAGAPAVMTLVVTLCSLLPAVAALARALLAATRRTLPNVATLVHLLLPLLLREKQIVVYVRWWQRIILHSTILCCAQPTAGIF
jgi:hypothetical protein